MFITQAQKRKRELEAQDWQNFFLDWLAWQQEDVREGKFLQEQEAIRSAFVDKYLNVAKTRLSDEDRASREVIDRAYNQANVVMDTTIKKLLGKTDNAKSQEIDIYLPYTSKSPSDMSADVIMSVALGIPIATEMITSQIKKLFDEDRANLMAVNEANWVSNHEEYDEIRNTQETKTWLSERDDRVRMIHVEADGQTVPVDEPFIVGGEQLMFPLDESLGASGRNIINCRCTIM